ncbi:hypothetical protein [Rufibacter roseus]|uniref:Uncharacterized protein n=1 Tax=Rufibacter roseus TaxID=1567108 RepID=A0ABW2DHT5_9BACT|nr:hypothetical protein [Rufibacter roseus]
MARGFFLLLVVSGLMLISEAANSQASSTPAVPPADSSQISLQPIAALYHAAMGQQAHVFNGSEYFGYTLRTKGHQFFGSDVWADAVVTYDGIAYSGIPFMYDIVNQALIVVRPDEKGTPIKTQIDASRVSQFTLQGHRFMKVNKAENLASGFYEVLYSGNVQVLARREKTSLKQNAEISFSDKNTYYILKDGQYHQVKSKGSVLKVLSDQKAELNKSLKERSISFGQNRELALVTMAQVYDSLTKGQ